MRVMIYGSGPLGRQALHLLNTYYRGCCSVAGFVDDVQAAGTAVISGHRVLGDLDTVARFPATSPAKVSLVTALEQDDPAARGRALARARDHGYRFPVLVHPSAIVEPDAVLGAGVIVLGGVTIGSSVRIGDFCTLAQGVTVSDDVTMGENNHLAAGVTVGSAVQIGRDNRCGLGTTIGGGLTVGDANDIPAGALLDHDLGCGQQLLHFPEPPHGVRDAVVFDEVSHA